MEEAAKFVGSYREYFEGKLLCFFQEDRDLADKIRAAAKVTEGGEA